jgi:beta-glucosidase/6-phospho-beta-glucosidase/beta-galactosidase
MQPIRPPLLGAAPSQVKGPLEKNDLGWEIYPAGLTDLLVRVSRATTPSCRSTSPRTA